MDYVADPSTLDVPLNQDEVAQLASNEGKALRNDPRRLSHFLARVLATMRRHHDEMRQLKGEIERARHAASTPAGQATTLSPMDAVRYLSPEQLQQVFGAVARQQMEWMQRQQLEADLAKRRATKIANDLKYLVVQLREDATMSRAPITERLAQIVSDADASVAVPGISPSGTPSQPAVRQHHPSDQQASPTRPPQAGT